MNINFELYRIFYVVANNKNMTRASEELFISQPAVSQSIKKLEQQLGANLFLRSNKGLQLTKEGQGFFDYIKGAMVLIKNAENEFENFKELKKGEIKIGASTTLTKMLLMSVIESFHRDYPQIKINIINDLTKNLITDLKKGKLDLVVFNEGNVQESEFKLTPIKQVNYAFVYNPNYFDFSSRTLSLSELNNFPLILQKENSNTRAFLDTFCLKNSVKLKPELEVVSAELVKEFTEIGLGIGFVIKELVDFSKFRELKLKQALPKTEVLLATHKTINPTFAGKEFIKYLK
jgi:DNA-binding transcriptional LysR family regulator